MINNTNLFLILLILISIIILYKQVKIENFESNEIKKEEVIEEEVPKVEFPFKNILDENNKRINIILISAPFREPKHEELYLKYKKMGLNFCGISSYEEFPDKLVNPYEDRFHEEKNHDYIKMVNAWVHTFRVLPEDLKKSGLPMLFMSEADIKNTDHYPYDENVEKEYDFIYVCLDDNDECKPGWQSHNRNWDLGIKCLDIMCGKYNLTGLLMGRKNCILPESCQGKIKIESFMPFWDFQNRLKKAKFIFVPNISDASPRVITESFCYNIPAIVNYNIVGGWHNIVSGETGELFTNENDFPIALEKILNNKYHAREWYINNKSYKNAGAVFATFLVENFPNINNKNIRHVVIP